MFSAAEPDYEFDKNLQDVDSHEKEVAEFECEVNDEDAVVEWFREDKVLPFKRFAMFIHLNWLVSKQKIHCSG